MAYTAHGSTSRSHFVNTILDDGWRWRSGPASEPTEIFVHITTYKRGAAGVHDWERDAFWEAMTAWEAVADVDFRHSRFLGPADLLLVVDDHRQFPKWVPDDTAAFQNGPYGARKNGGTAAGGYIRDNPSWTVAGTNPGGDGFTTILHELGHALGLAHPFDRGPSGASPIGLGEARVSHLTTAMAYAQWSFGNDGFTSYKEIAEAGEHVRSDRGYLKTPSPLDIAAVQHLYGANLDQDDGDGDGSPDDIYWLPASNRAGVGWITIWDTGGVDWIRYAGTKAARISLEPFQIDKGLNQQVNGQAATIAGGLMIAGDVTGALGRDQGVAGVVIENAAGGRGRDRIDGNAAANRLDGNGGDDRLSGRGGDDVLRGGQGSDRLYGGIGNDRLYGHSGRDILAGSDGDDQLYGGDEDDELDGGLGRDRLEGGEGDDRLTGGPWVDRFVFRAGDGTDVITDFRNDMIDLRWHKDVDSYAGMMEDAYQSGRDAVLRFDGLDYVTLKDVKLADLTRDDFLL